MKLVKRAKFDCSLFCWIYLYIVGANEPAWRARNSPRARAVPGAYTTKLAAAHPRAHPACTRGTSVARTHAGGSVWLRMIPMGDKSDARTPIKSSATKG